MQAVTRHQAHGLSAMELERWAEQANAMLAPVLRAELLLYTRTCRAWERLLARNISSSAADPDWDMTSAQHVEPSMPEVFLAQSLSEVGIPLEAQVGVSRYGGSRRGGWFNAYWLDWAHRDVAFLLRLDVELDGARHRQPERWFRDEIRDAQLQERGWYIMRIDSRILGRGQQYRAREALLRLVQRHRRSIVLARTDRHRLEQLLV
jgi:hypothetical protein